MLPNSWQADCRDERDKRKASIWDTSEQSVRRSREGSHSETSALRASKEWSQGSLARAGTAVSSHLAAAAVAAALARRDRGFESCQERKSFHRFTRIVPPTVISTDRQRVGPAATGQTTCQGTKAASQSRWTMAGCITWRNECGGIMQLRNAVGASSTAMRGQIRADGRGRQMNNMRMM